MFLLSIPEETSSVAHIVRSRMPISKRLIFSVVMFVLCFGVRGPAETHVAESRDGAPGLQRYGKVPLSFEPNRGQTDGRVQFLSRGPGYGIFLTPGEAVLAFNHKAGAAEKAAGQSVLEMKLVGANLSAEAEAEDKLPGTANYMKGTDRSKWATGVPTYGKVRYRRVYPGVDLVFYGNQRQLEYDFVVAPGRDAGKIALEFAGARPVADAAGDLVFADGGHESNNGAKFHKPVVYQLVGGERVAVAAAYEVRGQRVKFKLGKYDHSRELVIDPVVTYLTYLGGSTNNFLDAITVDSSGAAYVTGSTTSTDFPIKNAIESSFRSGATVMFVSKLNQSGTSLVYSTFLASNGDAEGYAVRVDANGSAYIAGVTDGDGFPVTSGAFQTICGGAHDTSGNRINGCTEDAGVTSGVLAKLSADGSSIIYATYLGGSSTTEINGIAVDQSGNAYVTGQTASYCGPGPYSASTTEPFECFPTTSGAIQSGTVLSSTPDGQGLIATYAFLTKFDATGSTLSYSSLLGQTASGSVSNVYGGAIAVTSQGVAFITGGTGFSPTNGAGNVYTTNGALQSTESTNGISAFVAAFDTNAGSLLYSTYLGGRNAPFDEGYGIAADSAGNAYVAGYTYDCDFPTTSGAFETEAQYAPTDTANVGKCHTGFVAKLNPTGNALVWATYLGSTPLVTGTTAEMVSLALGSDNSVYVAGQVGGTGFPLVNPVLSQTNTTQVSTVTHLSADGGTAIFSSTVGGSSQTPDYVSGIAVDASGAIYVAGATQDPHFPTTNNAVQPGFSGTAGANTYNGFVAKISASTPPTPNNGLTTNLLANPGAELGSIADWTVGGGGTPTVDTGTFDSGINPHTGGYDFLGHDGAADSLSQTVSILQQGITAAQVDGNTLFANVSFWEQGLNQGSPSDDGSVTLTFLNATNGTIGTVTTATVDSHDGTWTNGTGLYAIPAGTRSITYTMNFIRNQGSDNDAFIDDNVLSIHTNTGLTISPATLHFGNVAVGSLSAQTATVTNNQTTAITIDQIMSELGADPSEFGVSTYCPQGYSLAPGASCPITISFVPTAVGPQSAGIAINTEAVPPLQQIAVDGTGTGGILQVNPGNLKTIAGIGTAGDSGDGGPAIMAQLNQPNGVAFDPSGNLYISDTPANVVRKVDTTGKITTFAGTGGPAGFSGDGGPATQAELSIPFSVASDKNGNIYIEDTGNDVIRKVDATTGLISTFAGTPQTPGHSGDGGLATAAKFNQNQGARFDSAGNLFVPTCNGASVRKIDTTGKISTVAGNFTEGFSGDGGPATAAELQCPSGVTIDAAGNLYIADEFNEVIRKVNTQGVISTIAGTPGVTGYAGDGGAATAAKFNNPNDVVIDSLGNLYVADSGNNRVRKIDTNGVITTAAGGLNDAGSAAVNTPLAVTVDTANNVYFSDSGNSKIQEIFPQGVQPFPATAVGTTSAAKTLTLSNIGNSDVHLQSEGALTKSGNTGDFALTGGTCANGIPLTANGGSCTLTITFTPTAAGQRTLTVTIADTALNTPQSFSIGGTGTVAAGQQATPVITWATPAPITDTTQLSGTQLNATATDGNGNAVAGTFVYTPPAGTYLAAGTQALSVTFTPTDTTAFTSATKTVQIVVNFGPGYIDNLSPSTVAFPNEVIGTASKPVTINVNVDRASGSSLPQLTIGITGDFSLTDNCDSSSDTACTIQVTFKPTATGARTGTLTVTPMGGSTALTVALSGLGLATGTVANSTSTTLGVTGSAPSYTFTGTVVGNLGVGAPGSSVSFVDTTANNAVLGTATLGTATITTGLANGPSMPTGSDLGQVATADLNGDGKTDVVVLDFGSGGPCGALGIWLGNGDGTFTAKPSLVPPSCSQVPNDPLSSEAFVIGDFNGDGHADIALDPSGTSFIVYFGNGDGTFTEKTIPFTSDNGIAIAAGDFNGDGRSDLVFETATSYSNNSTYSTAIALGQADGTFIAGATNQIPSAVFPFGAGTILIADFNGDGNQDFEYTSADGVAVSLGNGDATFKTPVDTTVRISAGFFSSVGTGDFNKDNKADLLLAGYFGDPSVDAFLVLSSKGDGTFTVGTPVATSTATQGNSTSPTASVADFNGDGLADIAFLDTFGLQVFLNNGDGTYASAGKADVGTSSDPDFLTLSTADFNGDGLPDLISADSDTNLATVTFTQRAETAVASLVNVAVPGTGQHAIEAVYAGDTKFLTSTSPAVNVLATPLAQTITFGALSNQTYPGSPITLTATASSGLVVSYAVTGPATVSGATLTLTGVGTVTVTASQAGNATYAAAAPVSQTFVVTPAATAPEATTTLLSITANAGPITQLAAGSVVTLTASVSAAQNSVSPGQVAFCDGSCTGSNLLGTVQLVGGDSTSTATYKFVPGIGAHSYKAVFLGTNAYGTSTSSAAPLAVTGTRTTTVTLSPSGGGAAGYTLTAQVLGLDSPTVAPTGTVTFTDMNHGNAVLGASAVGSGTPTYTTGHRPSSPFAVGAGAYGVATGDFNNDGHADVVVGNYTSGSVSVLLGNGDGTFQPQVTYAVGTEPERVLVADLDGDGNLDLVVANTGSQSIGVLLGKGDGTFQAQVTYPCASPVGLGVMDINHDGVPDVVAGDYYANKMSVLLGNGDGTLKAAVTYATGSTPQTVAEGDFDGDGNVDVVVGNEGGATVGVFLGNGDGTFKAMVTYGVGKQPQGVQVGDFNGDGKQDLAVSNQGDGTVSVLLGNGDGTFQAQATYPVGVQPVGIAVADFNGDGIEDITVGNTGQASLTQGVLLGNGDGTFQPQVTFATGNFPYGVAVADFDGDGLPDMAVSNFNDATATVLLSMPYQTVTATIPGVMLQGTGEHDIVATYPGDAHFSAGVSLATPIVVGANTPVITWQPVPATIAYGTALSAAQLDATAATAAGVAIPGTFAYSPAAGTVLAPGTQTLSVVFTPTDTATYANATGTATIVVTGPALTALVPTGATSGSTDTKITLTGSGFVATSVVQVNGAAVATAYLNPTMLTAIVPAALLAQTGTLAVTVTDPSIEATTTAQTFTVVPPAGAATLTGPTTTPPGSQPTAVLSITNPYPLALTAEFTLTFASATTPAVVDPSIQFSTGGNTYSYTVAANTTSVPPVQLQAGTVAGTITIAAKLMADGVDVTPAGLAPLVIVVPPVVPLISGTTVTRSGDTLTVVVHGFSNTREVSEAEFDFTAATGDTLATSKVTIPATTIFSDWFVGDPTSPTYGSTFTYTQIFNTSADAKTIGSVKVTLTNSIGVSVASTSQ